MTRTITLRLKKIQKQLNVEADGILGAETLTALETLLKIKNKVAKPTKTKSLLGLKLSQKGINKIIAFEISSVNYYNNKLKYPSWPGGDSGITIGIGYDLGYQSQTSFINDWEKHLPQETLDLLKSVGGLKGKAAKNALAQVAHLQIPYDAAQQVFTQKSLSKYAKKALKAYPGLDLLYPDAQAAIVSLVYNRGDSLSDSDKRKEMRDLKDQIAQQDYDGISQSIKNMKRLWGPDLSGLHKRRDAEAELIVSANREYQDTDIFVV